MDRSNVNDNTVIRMGTVYDWKQIFLTLLFLEQPDQCCGLYLDPDTDPAFQVNSDPDPGP